MALKTVYVELLAETKGLNKGFKQAEKRVSTLSKGLKRLGGVLAGVFATRAVFSSLKGTVLDADQLIKTARAAGIAAGEYERLQFAFKRAGVPIDQLRQGLGDLQLRLGDTGKLYDKFYRQIGLDPKELRKARPAQQLEQVLFALGRIENQAERVGLVGRVLGEESGRQLLKLVAEGPGALREAFKDFDRIGSPLSRMGASGTIEELTKNTANFERAMEVLRQTVVLEAAPQITEAIRAISTSGVIGAVAGEITGLITQINGLLQELRFLSNAWDMMMADSPVEPGAHPIKRFLSARPFDAPSGGSASAKDSVIIYQNNKFTVVDRDSVRGVGRAVKKANEESMRAP